MGLSKFKDQLPDNGRDFKLIKACNFPSFMMRESSTVKIFKTKSAKVMTSCTRSDGDYVTVYIKEQKVAPNKVDEAFDFGIDFESVYHNVSGMTKQLINDMVRKNAMMAAEWMGHSLPDKVDGTKRTFKDSGRDIVPIAPEEKRGAKVAKESVVAAMAVSAVMALTTKGRSIFKDPDTLKTIRKGFIGKLKGKPVHMPDVPIKKVRYKKRPDNERIALRNKFNSTERNKFSKDLADSPKKIKDLRKRGFNDVDIEMLKNGRPPTGYDVHHKLPLDDGGTNDMSNLVLIKKSPFHSALTNEQNSFARTMIKGQTKTVEFPIPKGNIYPPFK